MRVVFIFIFAIFVSSVTFSAEPTDENIKELADLTRAVMKVQEEYLHIDYDDNFPAISITVGMGKDLYAVYKPEQKEIVFNAIILTHCDFRYLKKNLKHESFGETRCFYERLRETISHELGHYYSHLQILSRKKTSWLAEHYNANQQYGLENFAAQMLIEGIGEVFGDTFGDRTEARVADVAWTLYTRGEMDEEVAVTWFTYQGGHAIVRPILESQGYSRGINWIFDHPVNLKLTKLYSEQYVDWTPILKYSTRGADVGVSTLRTSL